MVYLMSSKFIIESYPAIIVMVLGLRNPISAYLRKCNFVSLHTDMSDTQISKERISSFPVLEILFPMDRMIIF